MNVIYAAEYRVLVGCLKEYRMRANVTQQELAACLGCTQTYVSKYEQCQKRLDILEVRNICRCLGVTLSELVTDFEERITLGNIRNK